MNILSVDWSKWKPTLSQSYSARSSKLDWVLWDTATVVLSEWCVLPFYYSSVSMGKTSDWSIDSSQEEKQSFVYICSSSVGSELLWVGTIIIELKWLLTTDYTDCSVPWHLFFLLFISWFCFLFFFWCVFVFFSWRMNLWFIGLHLSSRSFAMVSEPGCDTIKMEGRKKRRRRRWRGSDSSMHSSASIPSAAITPYRLYKHYANVCAAVQCAIMWCWR